MPVGRGAETLNRKAERVAVVTGGGSGIGRAIALRLAATYRTAVVGRTPASLEATVAEINAGGGDAIWVRSDISNEREIIEAVTDVSDRFGRLDVLVNNAAITRTRNAFLDMTLDEWDRILRVNLTGAFL